MINLICFASLSLIHLCCSLPSIFAFSFFLWKFNFCYNRSTSCFRIHFKAAREEETSKTTDDENQVSFDESSEQDESCNKVLIHFIATSYIKPSAARWGFGERSNREKAEYGNSASGFARAKMFVMSRRKWEREEKEAKPIQLNFPHIMCARKHFHPLPATQQRAFLPVTFFSDASRWVEGIRP